MPGTAARRCRPPPFAGFGPGAFAPCATWRGSRTATGSRPSGMPATSCVGPDLAGRRLLRRAVPRRIGARRPAAGEVPHPARYPLLEGQAAVQDACRARTRAEALLRVLFIHIDPEGCFTAAGFWQPEPAAPEAIRPRRSPASRRCSSERAPLAAKACRSRPSDDPIVRRAARAASPGGARVAPRPGRWWALAAAGWGRPARRDRQFAADALPLLQFGWAAIDGRNEA